MVAPADVYRVARAWQLHVQATNAPPSFVHVIILDVPPGVHYTAGEPDTHTTLITGTLRAGCSLAVRQDMMKAISQSWSSLTGQPEEPLLINITEVDASTVMHSLPGLRENPGSGRSPRAISVLPRGRFESCFRWMLTLLQVSSPAPAQAPPGCGPAATWSNTAPQRCPAGQAITVHSEHSQHVGECVSDNRIDSSCTLNEVRDERAEVLRSADS